VGAGGEVKLHLLASQRDDLRDARAGVVQGQQQSVVAPAGPGRLVGCGEQGFDLVAAEIVDQPRVAALDRDCHHPRHLPQVVRESQRDYAEERADSGEPVVA
jgi:hypothetical protein